MNPYERLMYIEASIIDMLANDCDAECDLYKSLCTEDEVLSYESSCDSEPSTAKRYPTPDQIARSL